MNLGSDRRREARRSPLGALLRAGLTGALLTALVAGLLAGCGARTTPSGARSHAGSRSSGATAADARTAGAPSATASMICGAEIRGAVRRDLALGRAPVGRPWWSHRLFTCTYVLPGGDLRLSVKDLDAPDPGRAYFDALRRRLPGSLRIRGVASFGFPAFETARGDVVFLKDHKTLWVDASRLRSGDVPKGETRQDVAYGVAAAVIACWTE